MKITIRNNGCFFRTTCTICGSCFELGSVNAGFYGTDLDYVSHGFYPAPEWRDVCLDCIREGPAGMIQRAKGWAERYAEMSREVAKFAHELAVEGITAPSMDDMKDALAMAYVERSGDDTRDWHRTAELELGMSEPTATELAEQAAEGQPF